MKRVLLLAALAACSAHEAEAPAPTSPAAVAPDKDAIVKTIETGPVKTTLTVWPAKPSLGDAIYLRLETAAPPGIAVKTPDQNAGDSKIGRFTVASFTRESDARQTYVLDAPASGHARIPPLRLEMIDGRATAGSAAKKPTEILTEEIPLDIAPMKDAKKDAELLPARGALDETVGGLSWAAIVGLAGALLVAISGSILLVRGLAAKRRIAKQRDAYDEAVAKLRELEAAGAPSAEDADRWFVELSNTVREYLEGRYEIRAPELTTEEFLQSVSQSGVLTAAHRELLASFLARCDEVKFAGLRPDSTESLLTLKSARGFIEDTRMQGAAP